MALFALRSKMAASTLAITSEFLGAGKAHIFTLRRFLGSFTTFHLTSNYLKLSHLRACKVGWQMQCFGWGESGYWEAFISGSVSAIRSPEEKQRGR